MSSKPSRRDAVAAGGGGEPGRELQATALGEGGICEPICLVEHAAHARAHRLGRIVSGRYSRTFRRVWTWQRWTIAVVPHVSRMALRSPLPPSITKRIAWSSSRPRSRRSVRSAFEGAGVKGIAARGVGEPGELELVAVDTAGTQARHEDAAAAERDLTRCLAVPVRAAIGVGHVLRPAQPRAILFHHRAQVPPRQLRK